MKAILNLLLVSFLFCFLGCFPMKDEIVTLSFWTDKVMDENGLNMVYINEEYIGDLNQDIVDPICNQIGLLDYKMNQSEDLHLTIQNNVGESIDIGVVNLYSVSTGIKIKPAKNSEIFVDHELDTDCTLVYLNWK